MSRYADWEEWCRAWSEDDLDIDVDAISTWMLVIIALLVGTGTWFFA
jgi:hypothetical protein